ncbi:hypothetical protein M231_06873 [Tremella mesenterica]|uniref:Uncharacterized protein n=1 Tax=Tremella mesenterica TaxID=5217 RepID=A0A4Q1BCS0_TREME|nr:hypothetical protein M231_06873 [Tremella mesenterica]
MSRRPLPPLPQLSIGSSVSSTDETTPPDSPTTASMITLVAGAMNESPTEGNNMHWPQEIVNYFTYKDEDPDSIILDVTLSNLSEILDFYQTKFKEWLQNAFRRSGVSRDTQTRIVDTFTTEFESEYESWLKADPSRSPEQLRRWTIKADVITEAGHKVVVTNISATSTNIPRETFNWSNRKKLHPSAQAFLAQSLNSNT